MLRNGRRTAARCATALCRGRYKRGGRRGARGTRRRGTRGVPCGVARPAPVGGRGAPLAQPRGARRTLPRGGHAGRAMSIAGWASGAGSGRGGEARDDKKKTRPTDGPTQTQRGTHPHGRAERNPKSPALSHAIYSSATALGRYWPSAAPQASARGSEPERREQRPRRRVCAARLHL